MPEVSVGGEKPSDSDVLSDLWNSPMARYLVADKLTVSLSSSVTAVGGFSKALSFDFITRGYDASLIPYITATLGVQGGAQVSGDASINFGGGYFSTTDMPSLRPGEAAGGLLGWSTYASADAVLVGSVTGSVAFSNKPFVSRPTWVSGSVGAGASIGAGATVGVSYTYPVLKRQFK